MPTVVVSSSGFFFMTRHFKGKHDLIERNTDKSSSLYKTGILIIVVCFSYSFSSTWHFEVQSDLGDWNTDRSLGLDKADISTAVVCCSQHMLRDIARWDLELVSVQHIQEASTIQRRASSELRKHQRMYTFEQQSLKKATSFRS